MKAGYFGPQVVLPSTDLKNSLSNLKKGTKVGLEIMAITDKYVKFQNEMAQKDIKLLGGEYYSIIKNYCKELGLEVVPLLDEQNAIQELYEYGEYVKTQDFKKFMNYLDLFSNVKLRTMIENIKKNSPEVNIVSLAFANRFGLEKTFGKVETNFELSYPDSLEGLFDTKPILSKELLQNSKAMSDFLNLYFNKKLSEKTSDYVGVWSTMFDLNAIGYFELFTKEQKIYDLLGEAELSNFKINDSDISFTKNYSNLTSITAKGSINYKGMNQGDGLYEGIFSSPDCGGRFIFAKKLPEEYWCDENFIGAFKELNMQMANWRYDDNRMHELVSKFYESEIKNPSDNSDGLPF